MWKDPEQKRAYYKAYRRRKRAEAKALALEEARRLEQEAQEVEQAPPEPEPEPREATFDDVLAEFDDRNVKPSERKYRFPPLEPERPARVDLRKWETGFNR